MSQDGQVVMKPALFATVVPGASGSNRGGAKTFSRENFRDDYAGRTLIQMLLNGKRNCVTSDSLENECHLQIKGTHITNKAKYN